jgi:hypothetical protein
MKERGDLQGALAPTPECASPVQLERLAEPDARMWEHVAACPRCQAEWTLLNAFESAAPLPGERGRVRSISRRLAREFSPSSPAADSGWRRWLVFRSFNGIGLALASLLVVIVLGFSLRDGRPPEIRSPSRADTAALRSSELLAVAPLGDVMQVPAELRWQPIAGAAAYSVRLMEVDRAEVWTAETGSPSIALPPHVLAQIVPGKPLLWQVTAKDAKGFALAESQVGRFRLRKTHP